MRREECLMRIFGVIDPYIRNTTQLFLLFEVV